MVAVDDEPADDLEVISIGSDGDEPVVKELPRVKVRDGRCNFEPVELYASQETGRRGARVARGGAPKVDDVASYEEAVEASLSDAEAEVEGAPAPFASDRREAKARLLRAHAKADEVDYAAGLLDLAEIYLKSGSFGRALASAKEAWAVFGDDLSGARAARLIIRAHVEQERLPEALAFAERYVLRFGESSARQAEAMLILALAEVHLATGRPKEALKAAEAARDILSRPQDRGDRLAALLLVAKAHWQVGTAVASRKALRTAEEALSLSRDLGSAGEEASALLLIARVHLARYETEDAYAFAKAAVQVAHTSGRDRDVADTMRQFGEILLELNEEPEAVVEIALEALQMYEQAEDWIGEIMARKVVARAYGADSLSGLAKEALLRALEVARKLRHRRHIREVLEMLCDVHPTDLALKLMAEEVQLSASAGDRIREVAALTKMASLNLVAGNGQEALLESEGAVALTRDLGDRRREALALRVVAEVHIAGKNLAAALGAASRTKSLAQEAGDVKTAAEACQMICTLHAAMGNDKEAVKVCIERKTLFRNTGWKEEEAAATLLVAALQHRSSGPAEAAKAAKEAIALYQALQDRVGEASAMLSLGTFQMSAKGLTEKLRTVQVARLAEALRTVRAARELFRSAGDSRGEAHALQYAADVHLEQNAWDQALAAAREALTVCQKAGDKRGEADAMRGLATVHVTLVQRDIEEGLKPSRAAIQEALNVSSEALELSRALNDVPGQVAALLKLSAMHVAAKDGEAALCTATAALKGADKVEETPVEGEALLAVAEALILLARKEDAKQAADDARAFFAELRDEDNVAKATRLRQRADGLPDGNSSSSSASPSAVSGAANCELDAESGSKWQAFVNASVKAVTAAQVAAQERRWQLLERPRDEGAAPDQSLRRRQLLLAARASAAAALAELSAPPPAAVGEAAGPEVAEGGTPPEASPAQSCGSSREVPHTEQGEGEDPQLQLQLQVCPLAGDEAVAAEQQSLGTVLGSVRPDWTPKDLVAVEEKLSKIGICTSADLFTRLQSDGVEGVNAGLRAVGQKCLRAGTLEALRLYGMRTPAQAAPSSSAA